MQNFLAAGWEVIVALLAFLAPWAPLAAWIAFWLLAVNWEKLYLVATKGAVLGILLIMAMMILTWGLIAPHDRGYHAMFGLEITNFVGKTIYVTMLMTIALLCGAVQLSGACGTLVHFPDNEEVDDHAHEHGHDGHDVHHHSHSSHGH